jgi:hypothetical protein
VLSRLSQSSEPAIVAQHPWGFRRVCLRSTHRQAWRVREIGEPYTELPPMLGESVDMRQHQVVRASRAGSALYSQARPVADPMIQPQWREEIP